MNVRLGQVVVTEEGVYEPPLLKLEIALLALAMLVVLGSIALGRASAASAWSGVVILTVLVVNRFVVYRRHGPLGKAIVAFREGELRLALPQDSRGQTVVRVAEFQHLIVYGRTGRRIFRFVRQNGSHIEVVPAWDAKVEHAAVEFLRGRLPPVLRVTVEEPQTLFASIRGDGP